MRGAGREIWCPFRRVAGDYFRVLGIRVLRGRSFSTSGAGEIVLSELAANELWPGKDPIGRHVLGIGYTKPREVVGVVADTRSLVVGEERAPAIYLPLPGNAGDFPGSLGMYMLLRCERGCAGLVPSVAQRLGRAGVGSSVDQAAPLSQLAKNALAPVLARSVVLSSYAGLGVGLALAGIFMLVSYLSAARQGEIGVRIALGATPKEVVIVLAKEGIASAGVGVCAGALAALGATQILRGLLFGVTPLDPLAFATAGAGLLLGATIASVFPAIWALRRHDPAELLRVTRARAQRPKLPEHSAHPQDGAEIAQENSSVRVLVICAQEDSQIARDCWQLLESPQRAAHV